MYILGLDLENGFPSVQSQSVWYFVIKWVTGWIFTPELWIIYTEMEQHAHSMLHSNYCVATLTQSRNVHKRNKIHGTANRGDNDKCTADEHKNTLLKQGCTVLPCWGTEQHDKSI